MGKRVDFTTTEERITWLKTTAARQEISVSQLINRLIRNRMKNEERFIKKTINYEPQKELGDTPIKILTKEEILKELEECDRELEKQRKLEQMDEEDEQ